MSTPLDRDALLVEANRLFSLCCLCMNLAAHTTDKTKFERLWKKHSQYAHKHRRVAAKIKALAES